MRTVNVRLVVILVVGAIVVIASFEGLRRFQVYRKADFYLTQAETSLREAEAAREAGADDEELEAYKQAAKDFALYLRLRRTDVDVSERLGLMEAELFRMVQLAGPTDTPDDRQKTLQEAAEYLGSATRRLEDVVREEQNGNRAIARRRLVDIYMLRQQIDAAKRHLQVLLRHSPDDAQLLELMGRCQATAREEAEFAAASFQFAIKNDPTQIDAYRYLASLLVAPDRLNRPPDADRCMQQMIDTNPQSFRAHLAFASYLTELTGVRSLDEAGKRPLLLDAMVPMVLTRAVNGAIDEAELADDAPDTQVLASGKAILAQATREALAIYDPNLALDSPLALLMAARRSTPKPLDTDAVGRAVAQAMAALETEEEAEDANVLATASRHNILVTALPLALTTLNDSGLLSATVREGLLAEAAEHTETALDLAARDREALMSVFLRDLSPDAREAVHLAQDKGILGDVIKTATGTENLDHQGKIATAFLERTGAKTFTLGVLDDTIKKQGLSEDEQQTLNAHRDALLDVVRHALGECERGTTDLTPLLGPGDATILSRAVKEAVSADQGVLSMAAKSVLEAQGSAARNPWEVGRKSLADALTRAIAAIDAPAGQRDRLQAAVERGVLVDALRQVLTDPELVLANRGSFEPTSEDRLIAFAVRRTLTSVEQALEASDSLAWRVASQAALLGGDRDLARQLVEQGIRAYPAEPQMYALLAGIASQAGEAEEALAALDRGLLATDSPVLLSAKAAQLLELGLIQEARVATWRLQKLGQAETTVGHLQARAEYELGRWGTALNGRARAILFSGDREFRDALNSETVLPPVRTAFGKSGVTLSENPVLKNEGEGVWSLIDRDGVFEILQEGQGADVFRAASRGFEQIRGRLANQPDLAKEADYLAGMCYAHLENIDQEIRAYRRALDTDPFYLRARLALADALLRSRRYDEALREYQQLVDLGASARNSALLIAQLLYERNRQRLPEERNWAEVEQMLSQVEAAGQTTPQAVLLRAGILASQSDEQEALARKATSLADRQLATTRAQDLLIEAERLLERAHEQNPEESQFWMSHIRLVQKSQDWERVELLLDQAEEALGDTVAVRAARASYLAGRYGPEAREQINQLATDTEGLSDADELRLYNTFLTLAEQIGDFELAQTLCDRVAAREPSNLMVRDTMLRLAFRTKDDAVIKRTLDEIETVEGKGALWCYGEAVRLGLLAEGPDDPKLNRAEKYLAEARELRPSWGRIPVAMASLFEQKGDLQKALENYLVAIDLGEYSTTTIRRAVDLLYRQGRFAEAGAKLALFDEIPDEMKRTAGAVYLALGNLQEALEMTGQVAADSEDYLDHIRFGQLLYQKGQILAASGRGQEAQEAFAQAEASLRKALELADDAPEPWVALAKFLANTGKTSQAEDVLSEARTKIPADQQPLALAQCYEAMGRTELADQHYEEALAAAPNDAAIARQVATYYLRRSEYTGGAAIDQNDSIVRSETILKRIADRKVDSTDADVLWARRSLALILRARGDYASQQKALELIDENLAESKSNPDDLRYKASILAADPSPERRAEATKILEGLPRSWRAASPEDTFTLWQLYLTEGNWSKASAQMTSLLATHSDQPQYVAAYAAALLDRRQPQAAEPYLDRLEKLAPNSFVTARLRAESLFQNKEYAETNDLLNRFVGNSTALPTDEPERARLMALLLEEFANQLTDMGEVEAAAQYLFDAETLCEKYVRARPGREWLLAGFLSRRGRIEEALQLIESSWRDSDPLATAEATSSLLKNPAMTEEQVDRIETIVQETLDRFDRPVPMLLVMAQTRAAQGRYDEAEGFYRDVIAKNPSAYQAMNNLAVLLALQGTKLPEALKLVNRAIDLAGPVAALLDSRASVYIAMKQPDRALSDLEKAVDSETSPIRLFHQARAYQMKGQRREAVRAMQDAQEAGLDETMIETLEKKAYQDLLKSIQ